METLLRPEGPASAYLRAVVAALGPVAGPTDGFRWPEQWFTWPRAGLTIGLDPNVLVWLPETGWSVALVDPHGDITGLSHALVAGAVVPRPEDVAAAAALQVGRCLDELPLRAAETAAVPGTRLTGAQQRAVAACEMTEDVARRLAVYTSAQTAAACA
ncbi:hypothetical protein [Streptacidiphilus sp. EB103A]|uniref:DUF6292 family protein n=1 Tax=Streptacidiphilus sp. EB103A TaxID=3156275 RepID=UPI0035118B68